MPPDAPPASWLAPLRGLLRERLGHELPEDRVRGEIAAFATARAKAAGVEGPGAWVDLVASPRGAEEWRRLVRAATVGETYFFRHPEQLRAITTFARSLSERLARPLALWSAGSATGEEAWSLAILLAESGVPSDVLATDVNDESLARARAAAGYSERSARHMPPDLRDRWLERGPVGFSVRRATDLRVTFALHNLARDPLPTSKTPDGRFDVILCRNVLLYFPPDLARDVITRLLGVLRPEGALWLGPADCVPTDLLLAHRDQVEGERFLRPTAHRTTTLPPVAAAGPPAPPARPRPSSEPDVARLLERGLVVAAEEALERRVARVPADGDAHLALAAIELSRHAFAPALAHLAKARLSLPLPNGYDYVRGVALLRGGRTEDAVDAFVDALEADPDDWAASLQLALHYRKAGRPLQEEVMLEHALLRLGEDPVRAPDHGVAAHLVDSVDRDAEAARRAVEGRLQALSGARPEDPRHADGPRLPGAPTSWSRP